MLIILASFVVFCLSLYFIHKVPNCNIIAPALVVVFGTILFFSVALLPVKYYVAKVEIQEYKALVKTIETARIENLSELERATITNKVADMNMWLAKVKYLNGTIFDVYIPDEVEKLEMVK